LENPEINLPEEKIWDLSFNCFRTEKLGSFAHELLPE
jgi:hypothetical protein